jgi:hypothetical protein
VRFTHHVIDTNNIDHYPLLTPVSFASPTPTPSPPSFPAELTAPLVAIAFILIIAGVVGALYYKKKTLAIKKREKHE